MRTRKDAFESFGWLCALGVLSAVNAQCPNGCNGHGECGTGNKCVCDSNWNFAPDCSQRICPKGVAWVSKANSANSAHQSLECSNQGNCDRSKGVCECYPGFTGRACQRTACNKDCSGHGTCHNIKSLGLYEGKDTSSPATGGDGVGPVYSGWDYASTSGCKCDAGFFGADCSLIMCPKGDDPVTTAQTSRTITLTTSVASGSLSGTVKFNFLGYTTSFDADPSVTDSAACKTAIEALENVLTATCTKGTTASGGAPYTITFTSWPVYPMEDNIHSHTGNPPLTDFSCDLSGMTGTTPACAITDGNTATDDITEYEFCSRRGRCNFGTGTCVCHTGYTGNACRSTTSAVSTSDTTPGWLVDVTGTAFTGDAMKIKVSRSATSAFDFIDFEASSISMFNVRGDGLTTTKKLHALTGGILSDGGITVSAVGIASAAGVTVSAGGVKAAGGVTVDDTGLTVTTGGGTVLTGGFVAKNTAAAAVALQAEIVNSAFTGDAFYVKADRASSGDPYNLMKLESASSSVFEVAATGKTTIVGGLTVSGVGIKAVGGVTVDDVGVTITTGGLVSKNTATNLPAVTAEITQSGFTGAPVLHVKTDADGASDGYDLIKAEANSVVAFKVQSSGKTTINAGGLVTLAGGATLAGGLTVSSAGGTITAGGLRVGGGITVDDSGVKITTGGATVEDGGLSVADEGVYAKNTATGVPAVTAEVVQTSFTGDAMLIKADAATAGDTFNLIKAQSGGTPATVFTVASSGKTTIAGGLTVSANGIKATGGVTVVDNGVVVTAGGVTTESVTSTAALDVNAAASNALTFSIGGTEKARIHTDGNFGIGTATPAVKLDVAGGVQGTAAYTSSSDIRWKKSIKRLHHPLSKIMNISGVTYEFRRDEFPDQNFEKGTHFGFIAQHLEHTLPEVVRTNRQGWKSVQYSAVVPVLVEAIKEQQSKIQEQDSRIQKTLREQESRIKEQDSQIQTLTEQIHLLREAVIRLERK